MPSKEIPISLPGTSNTISDEWIQSKLTIDKNRSPKLYAADFKSVLREAAEVIGKGLPGYTSEHKVVLSKGVLLKNNKDQDYWVVSLAPPEDPDEPPISRPNQPNTISNEWSRYMCSKLNGGTGPKSFSDLDGVIRLGGSLVAATLDGYKDGCYLGIKVVSEGLKSKDIYWIVTIGNRNVFS